MKEENTLKRIFRSDEDGPEEVFSQHNKVELESAAQPCFFYFLDWILMRFFCIIITTSVIITMGITI